MRSSGFVGRGLRKIIRRDYKGILRDAVLLYINVLPNAVVENSLDLLARGKKSDAGCAS